MTDPVYDEDYVNLGYLKKSMTDETNLSGTISKNYGSQPVPPYYAGDTWTDGYKVYTCINTRTIGVFDMTDWVTESGATEIAESKNKTYLVQPSNYAAGDTWILQSDSDHKAGKKGEILISTVGRTTYNKNDWINELSYGNVVSINECLFKIISSIKRLEMDKQSGVQKILFKAIDPPEIEPLRPYLMENDDLWYNMQNNIIYTRAGNFIVIVEDEELIKILKEVSQSNITDDGEIQVFYDNYTSLTTMERGDIAVYNDKTYRYNGTIWVEMYATDLKETIFADDVTERTTKIETDFGYFKSTVSETVDRLDQKISENTTEFNQTANAIDIRVQSIETNGTNKVQTSMGYTFDDSGLNIDKEGDLTSSKIDNKAFTVKDKSQDRNVFFAGYVDDVNSQYRGQTIVESTNLVVKNFLNIEGSSRFQPYTNPVLGGHGTGVFDIG